VVVGRRSLLLYAFEPLRQLKESLSEPPPSSRPLPTPRKKSNPSPPAPSQTPVTTPHAPSARRAGPLPHYALLKAASKEDAIEYTRRFLDHVGQGAWEIYQLYEMPT